MNKGMFTEILKKGDKFMAIIKKGIHSKTLLGEEKAGTRRGPFLATKVRPDVVETEEFCFSKPAWYIEKID